MHTNFGFSIGFSFREDAGVINMGNQTLVEPGMCFHARITLTGVDSEAARNFIAIGDTVLVDQNGKIVNLTEGI